uniref:Pseudouridine synthase RsuA/RluA-like domain-containing protein n=1 Tax=Alexandrium catenella TaxID=2925 RepID=A0A7S1QWR1_ALECA
MLSAYCRALFPSYCWPITGDGSHAHGFLHRLDVPASGLIVVAKTHEAFYDLQLQSRTGAMAREYAVLCHGWLPPQREEVRSRIHWTSGRHLRSLVLPRGKPSLTWLKVLARVMHPERAKAFSLVAVRIATGRKHQIRLHTSYVGHATVCDGRYTSDLTTFLDDRSWCPRNFLHRYGVAFRDRGGVEHQVAEPLPRDLADALRALAACGERSAQASLCWLNGDWQGSRRLCSRGGIA